jgi:hypothetical protein
VNTVTKIPDESIRWWNFFLWEKKEVQKANESEKGWIIWLINLYQIIVYG